MHAQKKYYTVIRVLGCYTPGVKFFWIYNAIDYCYENEIHFLSAKSSTSYRNQRGSDIAWLQHPRHSWRHERYVLMFNTSVTNCTLYFHRYEFEIYKHHSCQLCLGPLGSYWQCEFHLICTYSVKADWGIITFYSSSRQYLYTTIHVGNLPTIAIT